MKKIIGFLGSMLLGALVGVGCEAPCDCPGDDDTGADPVADDDTSDDDDEEEDDCEEPSADADGDGFTCIDGDCDDLDPAIHPDADDLCGDEVDEDCDGIADKGCRVLIPPGEFAMGADESVGTSDQHPQHTVWLDLFYIDRHEVTVGQHRDCMEDGVCLSPNEIGTTAVADYYDNHQYFEYPMVNLTRDEAEVYCQWAGGALPTEAQWEKAASGDLGSRLFPWGDWYDCTTANIDGCTGRLVRIGSYPENRSPYGVMDMGGNAWELIADNYDPEYYANSPYENPLGPFEETLDTAVRGGGFDDFAGPSVTMRHPVSVLEFAESIGFRCAYTDAE